MAQRYGTHSPAESGWALLEASLREALAAQGMFTTTYEQRKAALGNLKDPGEEPPVGFGCSCLALVLFFTAPFTVLLANGIVGSKTAIGWLIIILAVNAVVVVPMARYRLQSDRVNKIHSALESENEAKMRTATEILIGSARKGDFSHYDVVPEARPLAMGFYAEQQVGLELEALLPPEVQISHDVEVLNNDHRVSAQDMIANALIPALYGTTATARVAGSVGSLFLDALNNQAHTRPVANIDHIISTAAGVIVCDTKHWFGTLRLDEQGRFTAGPNHPGNEYRQKSISTLAFLADQVQEGEIAFILVIVEGGSVEGGGLETTMNGHHIFAIERKDALDFIQHIHLTGTLRQVPDMRGIDRRSPNLKM